MAVPECIVKEQWLGNNALSSYTFDFTIQDLQHLLVIVQDSTGTEVYRLRGDDVSFLAGVTFDSKLGGGTISLQSVLPNGWILTALQANDAPTQPSEFKDKFSFTLERFELALDYMITSIQRVAYLAQRSLKIHDLDDSYAFNPMLPKGIADHARATLIINSAANGFDYGPTSDDILAAKTYSDAASASASSAAASAASISGMVRSGPFAAIPPNTNLDLETIDHAIYTEVDYIARIKRGTTVYARVEFSIFYRNGAWEYAESTGRHADASSDPGVTFSVGVGGTINAAVANDGGSSAIIDLNKILWPG